MKSTTYYDNKSYGHYDEMSRDFFKYLKDEPEQDYYAALGSNQRVKVKKKFQKKAKKAYELCLKAIESGEQDVAYDKWKKVYGRPFPNRPATQADTATYSETSWRNTEQFIEDRFPLDIRSNIKIGGNYRHDEHMKRSLFEFFQKKSLLPRGIKLEFFVKEHDINGQYSLYWKVLNRGEIAKKKDMIRGEIFADLGSEINREDTSFRGGHIVECYAVQNGVVIAKDRFDVPIE